MKNTTYKKISDNSIEVVSTVTESVNRIHSYDDLIARRGALEADLADVNECLAKCDELGLVSTPVDLKLAPIVEPDFTKPK